MPDINIIINRDGNNYIYMMIAVTAGWWCINTVINMDCDGIMLKNG